MVMMKYSQDSYLRLYFLSPAKTNGRLKWVEITGKSTKLSPSMQKTSHNFGKFSYWSIAKWRMWRATATNCLKLILSVYLILSATCKHHKSLNPQLKWKVRFEVLTFYNRGWIHDHFACHKSKIYQPINCILVDI